MQSGLESFSDRHLYLSVKQARKEDFNYHCAYCGSKPVHLTIDHVIPRSQNGTNDPENLLPACKSCNENKGSQSLANWYNERNSRYSSERWERIVEVLGFTDRQLSA